MVSDYTFIRGYRTAAAYYPETVYGTYNVCGGGSASQKVRRVGGKVRNVNWVVRQNILKTSSVGQGRNYRQQLLGNYDASASMTWEVCDFSFLRFADGDIACFNNSGTAEANPFMIIDAELAGVDTDATAQTNLVGASTKAYTKIRVRPFSMLLYDIENAGSLEWNDSVDKLMGCVISDYTLSATLNSPIMATTNMVVREISHKRYISGEEIPDFTSSTSITDDYGAGKQLTAAQSQSVAELTPLMFYGGVVKMSSNTLGQVTSFNYGRNNGLLVYREIGDRFIKHPQLGMRSDTLSMNIVFRLPPSDSGLGQGIPTGNVTTIMEIVKTYLGYSSAAAWASATELRPSFATASGSSSAQVVSPIEQTSVELYFGDTSRGAKIALYNCAPEGFGKPVVLENGMVEVPVSFSVRGYPYNRVSDGSYSGHDGSANTTISYLFPTFKWWMTFA